MTIFKSLILLTATLLMTACNTTNGQGKQNSNHSLVNNPPVPQEQNLTLEEDNALSISLKATDPDKDTIGYRINIQPTHGTLAGKAPRLTYTPNKDYNGADSFTFIANDGAEDSKEATIRLAITPVNDAPMATDDTLSLDEDTNLSFDPLANDKDVDTNDTITITYLFAPAHGSAILEHNTTIHYTPKPNFNGKEQFNYKIADASGATALATITLEVKPVNDAPVAKDDNATTLVNTPMTIHVLNNDTDIDTNDQLMLTKVSPAAHANISIKHNTIFYTPDTNHTGTETLTYTIKDKAGARAQASVVITVRELNDAEKYAQLEDSGIIPKLDRSNTLGGTDSDDNGIRDDVDDYINKKYTNPKEKAAAQQMARAFQKELLIDLNNKKAVDEVDKFITMAIVCARNSAPDKNIMDDLMAATFNTKQRVKRFFAFDDLMDGSVTSLPEGDTCEQ